MGVALSDELGWTAQPLETYERKSLQADVAHIQDLVRRHEVGEVVMGIPLHMNGRVGPEAKQVQEFMATLGQALGIPVIAWDERLTTKEAEDVLIAANVSRKKRKGVVDRVAAAILLQSYLESRSSEGSAAGPGDDADDGGV